MGDLIDTTEMYLKSIYELEEDGVTPLRARIVERLNHSGPTVSQTVARMERDGLLHVLDDRRIEMTDKGRGLAVEVMRKHRLAERMLTDLIGVDWVDAHEEACRWEHVMSENTEDRLMELLNYPQVDPYGNPFPGMQAAGGAVSAELAMRSADDFVATILRIGEPIQADEALLKGLANAEIFPLTVISAAVDGEDLVIHPLGMKENSVRIPRIMVPHLFFLKETSKFR